MSDIVKTSITKDGNLLEIKMSHSNKETIKACLENIDASISASQKIIADPLVELKKNELNFVETKLKLEEGIKEVLNSTQIKNLKTNKQQSSTDMLYNVIAINNSIEIKTLMNQIIKIKRELSSEQTKDAGLALPINIEQKKFPSLKFILFLGLFLGGLFGCFFSLVINKYQD
jgi:uncharacterized protein involved in exopolysaccharide biosynthesis